MKFSSIVGISLLSGISGILLSQLILPAFTSNFQDTLTTIGIVDAANIMSWAAILMTLIGLIFTILILTKEYHIKPLLLILSLSFIFSILLLCMGSFVYLLIKNPEIFNNSTILLKILKFLTYPSLVSLTLETFQPIWIISTIIFLLNFNLMFYYLVEAKK
ncbi:MAG: hypothetical protein ACTSWL_08215 [Promethearchaeota archaeon]